ncbi:MAG: ABC transporter ATP-binding protein [Thermoproteota archaeon]
MIELSKVWKSYLGKQVLKELSLKVNRGELFCIIGPNGAGKTTTLRLIGILDRPDRGEVFFDGISTRGIDEKTAISLRRRIAFVFQQPVVYSTSIYGNVAMGLKIRGYGKREMTERVERALEIVRLNEFKDMDATVLSGGEVQRLCLARALAIEPELLLLDEPTANLDPTNVLIVEEVIREYNRRGGTVLFTTHNMFEAKRLARRLALLMNGEIVEANEAEGFFNNPREEVTRSFIRGELTA